MAFIHRPDEACPEEETVGRIRDLLAPLTRAPKLDAVFGHLHDPAAVEHSG
ncbi:MAG: hypothetical protein ACLP7Q_11025 [Isosphaeraceae bacterium]